MLCAMTHESYMTLTIKVQIRSKAKHRRFYCPVPWHRLWRWPNNNLHIWTHLALSVMWSKNELYSLQFFVKDFRSFRVAYMHAYTEWSKNENRSHFASNFVKYRDSHNICRHTLYMCCTTLWSYWYSQILERNTTHRRSKAMQAGRKG